MRYLLKYAKTTAFLSGTVTVAAFAPYYFLPAAVGGFFLFADMSSVLLILLSGSVGSAGLF